MAVTDEDLIHAITQQLSPSHDVPVAWQPAQFELMLEKLGLSEQECIHSAGMRAWCKTHKNSNYVPEWVLRHLKLEVSHDDFGPENSLVLKSQF